MLKAQERSGEEVAILMAGFGRKARAAVGRQRRRPERLDEGVGLLLALVGLEASQQRSAAIGLDRTDQIDVQRRHRDVPVTDRLIVGPVVRLPVVLPFFDPVVRAPPRIEAPMGSEVPLSLTSWDMGLLRAYYQSRPELRANAQRSEIRRGLGKTLTTDKPAN